MRDRSRNAALVAQAQHVVPGGMWGHHDAAAMPPGYPQYFVLIKECHLRDVDDNRYVDFVCSWGPIIRGHGHQAVDEAAWAQAARGGDGQ
ncbi:MAG TPA: aminotransferase class III-fold pyridoxal phosphate-dependent enzyme [Acetobacteraceae bacterium]|jgi:glutamate-1-semialdehyde 2,1-aminomutase|nr:aminotransferase class III-fold pyridoxal phosphate-dependent enzyme [Acetobacteraceae bacterium]